MQREVRAHIDFNWFKVFLKKVALAIRPSRSAMASTKPRAPREWRLDMGSSTGLSTGNFFPTLNIVVFRDRHTGRGSGTAEPLGRLFIPGVITQPLVGTCCCQAIDQAPDMNPASSTFGGDEHLAIVTTSRQGPGTFLSETTPGGPASNLPHTGPRMARKGEHVSLSTH